MCVHVFAHAKRFSPPETDVVLPPGRSVFHALLLQNFLKSKSLPLSGVKSELVVRVGDWLDTHG